MIVRDAVNDDIPALVDLLTQLYTLEPQFSPNPELQEKGLMLALGKPELCRVLVLEAEGKIAGMATLLFAVSTANGGMSIHVDDFIITQKLRRNGAGKVLMESIFNLAKDEDFCRVTLNMDLTNTPALAFYKAMGFMSMSLSRFQKMIR